MITIVFLNTSHDIGSLENMNEKISEMMNISTETKFTIKNMYHEFTQWKQYDNMSKHVFIF